MYRWLMLVLTFFAFVGFARPASAEDDAPHSDVATTPQNVKVALRLEKLSKFEVGPGSFVAEGYVTFRCEHEPCKIDFEILNGKLAGKADEVASTSRLKEYRLRAELDTWIDLSEYPFDEHVLPIALVDRDESVRYEADESASVIDEGAKLPGWTLSHALETQTLRHKLDDGRELTQASFSVAVARPRVSAFFKSLVPVMFMVFVAGFTLILKPKSAGGRLSTATGALMTVVMFHLASTSSLPPLGYLTRMDKFMLATYLVYLVNIALSAAMVRFDEKKKPLHAELAYLVAAGAVPGLTLVAWTAVFARLV